MRFCDKLPKLRKDNNYSQEQLADKLNVSRQAVSKWEMGSSYPDMDKILHMCKILNCNLEDLMDDGVLGDSVTYPKSNKFNINMYMKDFLNFITKSYNMFCSMKFKEKMKFIFEMSGICLVLLVLGLILHGIIQEMVVNITESSRIGWIITNVVKNIFIIMYGIISVIITLHLFKIRYLDYFVTIEDQNVTEKTIEEPIEKTEDKYYQEKPKEKIIIRDAKHSTFSFFDVLGKAILIMLKAFVIMSVAPVIAIFVCSVGCVILSLCYMQYGIIFLWIAVSFLGMVLLGYSIMEWAYNFVAGKKQHLKRIFIISIVGLTLLGAGMGMAVGTYLNYEKASDFKESDYETQIITLPVNDNTIFHYNNYGYTYVIDSSVDDIQVEVKSLGLDEFNIAAGSNYVYEEYYGSYTLDFLDIYQIMLEDIKNKKIRNYDSSIFVKVTITMSQETKQLLDDNYIKLEQLIEEERKLQEELYIEEYNRLENFDDSNY